MAPHLFFKAARNFRNSLAIRINRARGREFIPARRDCLSIETSSICNLKCVFCAYPKKQSPRVVMSEDFFRSCVAQALDLGYTRFDLTPCTGDVFMDRRILHKVAWLDEHPQVASYAFHTNFTIPRRDDIAALARLRKIEELHISVYGHDPATFVAVTKAPAKLYTRLVANLERLYELTRQRALPVSITFHTAARTLRGRSNELITVLEKFVRAGVPVTKSKRLYNNWGGYVTQEDVAGLPLTVLGPDMIYKNGACVRLFTTLQIMATGIVNGCACRDADATLALGNLHEKPLREIISSRNPAYMALIDEQQRGEFRPICRSCDFYASIYHKSSVYRRKGVELTTLEEFRASIG
jgi:hypothetical protein